MKTRMHKYIITVVILILALKSFAQTLPNTENPYSFKHTFSFGYGVATSPALAYATTAFLSFMLPLPGMGALNHFNTKFSGAFFAGYHYSISPRISVGGTFAYEKGTTKDLLSDYTYTGHYYAVLGGAKYLYNPSGKISLYGRADLGLLIYSAEESPVGESSFRISPSRFALQISPFCIRVGKRMGAYCEFGFGNIGLINLGVDARF